MNPCYLFSAAEVITNENWEHATEHGMGGLAEWFDHVPKLFLLLLSGGFRVEPWPAYDDGNFPPAFLTEREIAIRQLGRIIRLLVGKNDCADVLALLRRVGVVLAENPHQLLVLHYAAVLYPQIERKYDSDLFRSFTQELQDIIKAFGVELDAAEATGSVGEAQPHLSQLLTQSDNDIGYWGAKQIYDGYWLDLEYQPEAIPAFLATEGIDENHVEYDGKLGAYIVKNKMSAKPRLWGVATPYGRWLIPMGEYSGITTNRYVTASDRSWITAYRNIPPREINREKNKSLYALFDANGREVLPMIYESLYPLAGDKLVAVRTLEDYRNRNKAVTLMRLDTNETLPEQYSGDRFMDIGDGLIAAEGVLSEAEVAMQESGYVSLETAPRKLGIINHDGKVIVPFEYSDISAFHKKHGVAMVRQGNKCGLINRQGKLVVPLDYSDFSFKLRDGPPHFHGSSTLVFVYDEDDKGNRTRTRVGVVDKKGKVLAPPKYDCWHLNYAFDKDGKILVHEGDQLYFLYANGTLSEPAGSRQDLLDEIKAQFSGVRQRAADGSGNEDTSGAALAEQVDRKKLEQLLRMLSQGNNELADQIVNSANVLLDSALAGEFDGAAEDEDSDDENEDIKLGMSIQPGDSPAKPFFMDMLVYEMREVGLIMHLDWKAVDEITHASSHLQHIDALKNFKWDGVANGEGMEEAFVALDAFLAKHQYRLVTCDTDGDYYMLGAIPSKEKSKFGKLVDALGLPVRLVT